jgi:hypothetical protein
MRAAVSLGQLTKIIYEPQMETVVDKLMTFRAGWGYLGAWSVLL